jgi:hypothetical protein
MAQVLWTMECIQYGLCNITDGECDKGNARCMQQSPGNTVECRRNVIALTGVNKLRIKQKKICKNTTNAVTKYDKQVFNVI